MSCQTPALNYIKASLSIWLLEPRECYKWNMLWCKFLATSDMIFLHLESELPEELPQEMDARNVDCVLCWPYIIVWIAILFWKFSIIFSKHVLFWHQNIFMVTIHQWCHMASYNFVIIDSGNWWLVAKYVTSHHLHQWWLIVYWTMTKWNLE